MILPPVLPSNRTALYVRVSHPRLRYNHSRNGILTPLCRSPVPSLHPGRIRGDRRRRQGSPPLARTTTCLRVLDTVFRLQGNHGVAGSWILLSLI
jgi:hypothetical protein